MIEFFPDVVDGDKFLLLLSYNRIPIHKNYEYAAMANSTFLNWNSYGGD